jgi:hypothetical protein
MPDLKRSEQCKRAWDTIRANRAARAAGLPVAAPASSKPPKASLLPKIAAWLEPIPEAPAIEAVPDKPAAKVKVRRVKASRGKRSRAA